MNKWEIILTLAICSVLAKASSATAYYSDFAGGADSNCGDSPATAFKHCPGDPEAKEKAAEVKLQPGDQVLFKGGVVYRGNIVVPQSGIEGKPITYAGNSQEKFGSGRAIVDGSDPLTGWRKCASAEECDGNPNWNNIWWTEAPFPIADPTGANLYENQNPLDVAQEPKTKYRWDPDPATEYFGFDVNTTTTTTIQDEKHLFQTQPHAWDGAFIGVRSTDYWVHFKVTGFDPATHKITFQEFKQILGGRKDSQGAGQYSLLNALVILNYPGQYVVRSDNKKAKIYLWPLKSGAEPSGITITRRHIGFNLNGQSYVTIEGFLIQKFVNIGSAEIGTAIVDCENKPNGGLVIRDNIITACNKSLGSGKTGAINLTGQKGSLVEKNQICDNRGSVGIRIYKGAGHVLKENSICGNGGVGILLWQDLKNCQIIGNTIKDNTPDNLRAHSPVGILLYKGCANILIKGNLVMNNGQRPLALYSPDSDITIACNVFRHKGPYVMEGFGAIKNIQVFHNVAICDDPEGKIFKGGFPEALKQNNIFVANGNILDKDAGFKLDDSHNLYTDLAHMRAIFSDPEHHDYTLKKGSPAIGAGSATEIQQDALGTPFSQDKAPDVGAFVYTQAK